MVVCGITMQNKDKKEAVLHHECFITSASSRVGGGGGRRE
jgi:hypothetical protein